jgi:hypothetical protein
MTRDCTNRTSCDVQLRIAVPLHEMDALAGRGGIVTTHF